MNRYEQAAAYHHKGFNCCQSVLAAYADLTGLSEQASFDLGGGFGIHYKEEDQAIPYEAYNQGGALINLFLSPATACLAVAIYGKRQILKENWLPILVGCAVGSAASMGSILLLCRLFGLDEAMIASLLPKSVTTPIAISVSQAHGGIGSITVVAVLITGIFGSIAAPLLIKLFRVREPMTAGLAIGACSHAVGTSKALELGETEGAMSGLAIGVCGIVTVVFSLFLM